FFFQAEDGIRDDLVTGVQTCALPIFPFHFIPDDSIPLNSIPFHSPALGLIPFHSIPFLSLPFHSIPFHSIRLNSIPLYSIPFHRSEERRVGKDINFLLS